MRSPPRSCLTRRAWTSNLCRQAQRKVGWCCAMALSLQTARVRGGRVEDGRGSWGPMAITPFPISAHRTGGPDFRSPALRLASPQGTRRGSEWQAFEAQQTEFPIDSVVREPARAAPCHFVPSCEEVTHALVGIAVNAAEC